MESFVLEITERSGEELKKNSSGRLRKQGFIPAVLYGLKSEPLNIKVSKQSFKDLIKGKNLSGHIFDLHLKDGGKTKKIPALVKESQREPLSREFYHIDFMRIKMEQEVTISVPILILNEEKAIGIKEEGGVLQHGIREIEISCLPKDIIENIELDISDLKLNEALKISDLKIPEHIKILNDPEEMILTISYASMLKEEEAAAEPSEAEPEVIKKEKSEAKEESK